MPYNRIYLVCLFRHKAFISNTSALCLKAPEIYFATAIRCINIVYFVSDAINTPIFVEECRALWNGILDQRIAIAAFVDNPNKGGKPVIAGMNMLCVEFKENANKKLRVSLIDCFFSKLFQFSVVSTLRDSHVSVCNCTRLQSNRR